MKKILLLLIVIFFATQILPIKYVGFLCDSEMFASNIDDDDFSEEEDNSIKAKEKFESEFESPISQHTSNRYFLIKSSKSIFPTQYYCIPNDYVCSVIVPPPNV